MVASSYALFHQKFKAISIKSDLSAAHLNGEVTEL